LREAEVKASVVFFTAHFAWPMRVGEYPAHEGAAPATREIIDPDVSTRSMKYGFYTAGHALGSGRRQLAGSGAAWAGVGAKSAATVRTVAATAAGVGRDRKRKRAMGARWARGAPSRRTSKLRGVESSP